MNAMPEVGSEGPEIPRPLWQLRLYPLALTFLALAAGGIAAFIIDWRSGKTQFGDSDGFHAWIALVALLFMLVATLVALNWSPFIRVCREARCANILISVGVYAIIFVVAVVGPVLLAGSLPVPVYLFYQRILVLALLLFVAVGDCFCGLILLGSVLRERGRCPGPESVGGADAVRELLVARSDLRRFLWGAATLITGMVFVVGGLQNALNSYANSSDSSNMPTISSVGVLLYGAFFAALLALVSVPTYTAWQARASALRDRLYPLPHGGRPHPEWYAARSNLEELLQMRIGTGQRFAAILGILAPLAVGVISAFIPTIRGG
jgi:hypothetical protein